MSRDEGRRRVVVENVTPQIDGGRFPAKRTVGEEVVVEADVFADGHDEIRCLLLHRPEAASDWREVAMEPLWDDRWRGSFRAEGPGRHVYAVEAWVDDFRSWRQAFEKRVAAGQDLTSPLLEGALLVRRAAERASGRDRDRLAKWAQDLAGESDTAGRADLALGAELAAMVDRHPDRTCATRASELTVRVDRERARFSTWYEMFPRSCSPRRGKHGTFRDCEGRLAEIADMGFDVLYLPPVHPIGRAHRKGKNNRLEPGPNDPGSPWAIGGPEGGHKAVHPDLGTVKDFRRLVEKAAEVGIEIALDIAFQCSPDHPYVTEHPEWFRQRPDGSIQHAENPPKKYEDIYPFDFTTDAWRGLWDELESVFEFWIEQGVRIFRVDNPHTKPFPFWEWVIARLQQKHPDVIFLAEAFTRPKVMYRLAKLGFTQSYTYFAWRNTKWELQSYFNELTTTGVAEYFRPNLWPNTPDILTEYLQFGGRAAFVVRLVLAATLGASYGIYGPAFELMENRPREAGSEEYLDSEKYEVRSWASGREEGIGDLVALVNKIRRENPALQSDRGLRFHDVDNEEILCYSKRTNDNLLVMVVNLDPHHIQSGWVTLPLGDFEIDPEQPYQAHDLLSGSRYLWNGPRNFVQLHPEGVPAHVFRIRRKVRSERDFDYYL